jgi:hypothetical protein
MSELKLPENTETDTDSRYRCFKPACAAGLTDENLQIQIRGRSAMPQAPVLGSASSQNWRQNRAHQVRRLWIKGRKWGGLPTSFFRVV